MPSRDQQGRRCRTCRKIKPYNAEHFLTAMGADRDGNPVAKLMLVCVECGPETERECRDCGQVKPLNEQLWERTHYRDGRLSGWRRVCRKCMNVQKVMLRDSKRPQLDRLLDKQARELQAMLAERRKEVGRKYGC